MADISKEMAVQLAREAESCSNCKNNVWPFGSCDGCGTQNDDPDSGSNWEPVESLKDNTP